MSFWLNALVVFVIATAAAAVASAGFFGWWFWKQRRDARGLAQRQPERSSL